MTKYLKDKIDVEKLKELKKLKEKQLKTSQIVKK
jgi:hypothetical protein